MDRRSFLGALMGLAAAPVLAKLLPLYEDNWTAIKQFPTLEGFGMVFSLNSSNVSDVAKHYRILRADGSILMQQCLPRFGVINWFFSAHDGLVFHPDQPLIYEAPAGLNLDINYSLNGQDWQRRIRNGGVFDLPLGRP